MVIIITVVIVAAVVVLSSLLSLLLMLLSLLLPVIQKSGEGDIRRAGDCTLKTKRSKTDVPGRRRERGGKICPAEYQM